MAAENTTSFDRKRRLSRTTIVIGLIVFVVLAGLGAGALYVHRQHQVPWDEMDADLASVRPPTPYTLSAIVHRGRLCYLSPTCERPVASLDIEGAPGLPPLSCSVAEEVAATWDGFTVRDRSEVLGDGCSIVGRIRGRPASVSFVGPERNYETGERWPGSVRITVGLEPRFTT
jgi:hypothetical protein